MFDDIKISVEYKDRTILEALKMLTDEYIDGGNCYNQTIVDLRDACKGLLSISKEKPKCCLTARGTLTICDGCEWN